MVLLSEYHQAIQCEAQLAGEQIAHGVTVLGRANHAQPGLYVQAFFGLSIGLERMCKLIFVANYTIAHSGHFPTDKDLRKFGHDLSSLLSNCEEIGKGLDPKRDYRDRPSDPIHQGIEEVLSLFATNLRYYNLNHLAGAAKNQRDPIALWWEKVALPICDKHYSQRQRKRDKAEAAEIERIIGGSSVVLHTSEDGQPIRDVPTFFARSRATRVVQKYGRLYTLQIVRWLSSIILELSYDGAYKKKIEALLGLHEPFVLFFNEDKLLRGRKTWSIYQL